MAKKRSDSHQFATTLRWKAVWSASVPLSLSRQMATIRSKDTKPEMLVRRIIHAMGYRYRLHVRALPGSPDIVLPRHRKIIDVRGCFWHMHACGCAAVPSSRREYWLPKLTRNRARDCATIRKLRREGWRVLIIWECEALKHRDALERRIGRFLFA
jgi:DNA mismatch endonuclease (patch repair protein)